jgi:hypothetical protein
MRVRKWPIGRHISQAAAALIVLAGCGQKPDPNVAVTASDLENRFHASPKPGPALPAQPATKDPVALLAGMVSAYKTAESLQVSSESDQFYSFPAPQRLHQTIVLKYRKRPAGVAMSIKDTSQGTQHFYGDGAYLVHHLAVSNTFDRRTARGEIAEICAAIEKQVPFLISPIVFLQSGELPRGMERLTFQGIESAQGKQLYVVKGTFSRQYLADLAQHIFSTDLTPKAGDFTLWLDSETRLLRQSAVSIAWKGRIEPPRVE